MPNLAVVCTAGKPKPILFAEFGFQKQHKFGLHNDSFLCLTLLLYSRKAKSGPFTEYSQARVILCTCLTLKKLAFEKNLFLSRAWFRSTDLWVMGPARFHCATLLPGNYGYIEPCNVCAAAETVHAMG